ncbi:MAG TPA: hypothetical protein DCE81_05775 [Cytophagales bacterium]|nr:hypothetical protein [Cytophagales bacterium]
MNKDNDKKMLVKFDYSNEVSLFADIAEINVKEETVSISFAIQSRDGQTAKVSHTIFLTVPHFIRLADVSKGLRDNIVDEITKRVEEFNRGNNTKK